MTREIENAIKLVTEKITSATPAHEVLHLTQSALNLAHAAQVLKQVNEGAPTT